MAVLARLPWLAAVAISAVASLQIPLHDSEQTPLAHNVGSSGHKLPLIDTEALQKTIKADNLFQRAEKLYEIAQLGKPEYNHPTRVIGSEGHLGTIAYIYSTLSLLGDYYNITKQDFPAVNGNVFEFRLVLGDAVPSSATAMSLTPPTKNKEPVHGDLALVANNGCDASDFPENMTGKIALIKRGICPFGTKSAHAGVAGAVAAVVYNNDDTGSLHGTLGTPNPNHIATFGISLEEALPIIETLGKGDRVDGIAYIDAEIKTIVTTNIVAQTTDGDQDNCVMLGGHSDGVDAGPGINDDGSGTLTLLEIAVQLASFKVNNCVRFAWWSAEEEGLLGSDYYVSVLSPEENRKIRLFMDYDMLASPNYAYQIYDANNKDNPVGSQELVDLYTNWYKDHNLNYTFTPFDGRSDYVGFITNGIPGGGIATGADGIKTEKEVEMFGGKAGVCYDECYHQLCDDLNNLDMKAWVDSAKLVAHTVATYARSFEGFPERTDDVEAASANAQKFKYHGDKLAW